MVSSFWLAIYSIFDLTKSRDWYRAAQSSIILEPISPSAVSPIEEHEVLDAPSADAALPETTSPTRATPRPSLKIPQMPNADAASAQRELRLHEITALFCCFACPLLAAWLLHTIRSQLTRPSEGLVSNYNLTIFLLVAEVRPLAHLIKLIQRRTFFLQRRVNVDALSETKRADTQQVLDITHRLDALEVHVADRIASSGSQDTESGEAVAARASVLATAEVKKLLQPELDALNRAMRRYEKRTAISSVQIEARLQDLEGRLQDVVALAAAVQRNADRQSSNYASTLFNWMSAMIVVPMQYLIFLSSLPGVLVSSIIAVPRRYLMKPTKNPPTKEHRNLRKGLSGKIADRERRSKQPQVV